MLHAVISGVCFLQVMSAVQAARYMAACYPMGPDTLCLMTCLAQQANEPATGELMCAARPRTAAPARGDSSAPLCVAGDWRQGLVQPPTLLLGRPKKACK